MLLRGVNESHKCSHLHDYKVESFALALSGFLTPARPAHLSESEGATWESERMMEETHTAHTGEEDEEITQEDSWHVISAFFEEKGLVRQQLESFDDFLQYKMQDIVDEDPTIVLTPEAQHMPGQTAAQTQVSYAFTCAFVLQLQLRYEIQFNQVWLSKTNVSEPDSSVQELYPQEARLRNLTYVCPSRATSHR